MYLTLVIIFSVKQLSKLSIPKLYNLIESSNTVSAVSNTSVNSLSLLLLTSFSNSHL